MPKKTSKNKKTKPKNRKKTIKNSEFDEKEIQQLLNTSLFDDNVKTREPKKYDYQGKKYTAFELDILRSRILNDELNKMDNEKVNTEQMMNTVGPPTQDDRYYETLHRAKQHLTNEEPEKKKFSFSKITGLVKPRVTFSDDTKKKGGKRKRRKKRTRKKNAGCWPFCKRSNRIHGIHSRENAPTSLSTYNDFLKNKHIDLYRKIKDEENNIKVLKGEIQRAFENGFDQNTQIWNSPYAEGKYDTLINKYNDSINNLNDYHKNGRILFNANPIGNVVEYQGYDDLPYAKTTDKNITISSKNVKSKKPPFRAAIRDFIDHRKVVPVVTGNSKIGGRRKKRKHKKKTKKKRKRNKRTHKRKI